MEEFRVPARGEDRGRLWVAWTEAALVDSCEAAPLAQATLAPPAVPAPPPGGGSGRSPRQPGGVAAPVAAMPPADAV